MSSPRTKLSWPVAALAALALVVASVATVGGSYAAAGVTAKQAKKIAAKVVKKKATKLTVKNAKNLGGKAPSAYLDRFAHENLTVSVDIDASDVTQIMNPTVIEVPAGVGYIHVTAVASFAGGATNFVMWPMLDSICLENGEGYDNRALDNTTQQTSATVDYVAAVSPGEHSVRLCVVAGANTDAFNRSLTIETVAGDYNG